MHYLIRYLPFLAALTLLSRCSSLETVHLDPLNLERIEIGALEDANNGQPIPVDLVFVKDKETLEELEGFAAFGWFTLKESGLGDWTQRTAVQSLVVEPGNVYTINDPKDAATDAIAVVVYASYNNHELNRLIFTDVKEVKLVLTRMGPQSETGQVYFLTSPPERPQEERPRY